MTTAILIVIVNNTLNANTRFYIWGTGNLLSDLAFILIFNAWVNPALYILNFEQIGKLFQRCRLYGSKGAGYSQRQAHKIVEGAQLNPVQCYADIYATFMVSMFFVDAYPSNTLIHCGTTLAFYVIQKYYLLRIYARPKLLQYHLCKDTLPLLKVGIFANAVSSSHQAGQMYFDSILRKEIHWLTILVFTFTALCLFIPIEDIFKKVYRFNINESAVKKHVKYADVKDTFISEYMRENPATNLEPASLARLKGVNTEYKKRMNLALKDLLSYSNVSKQLSPMIIGQLLRNGDDLSLLSDRLEEEKKSQEIQFPKEPSEQSNLKENNSPRINEEQNFVNKLTNLHSPSEASKERSQAI